MKDCLFCKIVAGEIPSNRIYEDDVVYCFEDVNPQAPEHILIIPKEHVDSIADEKAAAYGNAMFAAARIIAKEKGLDESGFRCVMNMGEHGQQSVDHLHMHVIGGRQLNWPPG